MKIFNSFFILITATLLFTACQKEIDFDESGTSEGTFKKTLSGDCSPVTIFGAFLVDSVLTNNNYVDVEVNVTTGGAFEVKSDTMNGFSFSKTGTVGRGSNIIRLYPSGKPIAPGVNNFTITYGNSVCNFSITVFNAPSGGALFTLGGSPANCNVSSVNGVYTVGQAMTSSNTVEITVNVTAPGTFSITGTSVDGISFGKTGIFTNPGVQNVFLQATGTPVSPGTFTFPITNLSTNCSFPVTITAIPPNADYIPETSGSNWSDKLKGGNPGDTSYTVVSANTIVLNSITYKIFEEKFQGTPVDSAFHRKNGGSYYELFNDDFGIFDTPFNVEGLVLDSSMALNGTWTIILGSNTVASLPVTVKINGLVLAKGATATIAGISYSQIIKVKYSYVANPGTGDQVFAEREQWFAKGFGLIYDKINDVPVTTTVETETTRIQIF